MDVSLLSKEFSVRKLYKSDIAALFELMRKNTLYYQYHPPLVTVESIEEDMRALPSGKSSKDKYYIGFFENEKPVAVADIILDYPAQDIAFVGFFMTDVIYQGKGIGSKIISEVCESLKTQGYKKVRLGVDKGNPQSYSFWAKNCFCVVNEKEYIVMERLL